jgi:hypothetical protein
MSIFGSFYGVNAIPRHRRLTSLSFYATIILSDDVLKLNYFKENFMKGIRLSHGAVFVKEGLFTVRLLPSGECGASPVTYESLEWELRTEPPHMWEYISEWEIENLPDGGGEKIRSALESMCALTESKAIFTCEEDFFKKAASFKKLPREIERELALLMAQGDESARENLVCSYLPEVSAFIKRTARKDHSLELIYRLVASLEKTAEGFDFQQEREPFSRRLAINMKKTLTEYIADK